MNNNDLFDALTGIDPKFIDEAAYELHEDITANETGNLNNSDTSGTEIVDITKRRRLRSVLYIALPSVAAILLIVGVAIPAVMKVSKSEGAMPASYDSAAEAPAAEAAQEETAPEEAANIDESAAEEAEEAPVEAEEAVSEEAPAESYKEAGPAAAEDAARADEAAGEAVTAGNAAEESTPALNAGSDTADLIIDPEQHLYDNRKTARPGEASSAVAEEAAPEMAEEAATASETADSESMIADYAFTIESAEYDKGLLTVNISGKLPYDIENMEYVISKAGTENVVSYGLLTDLITPVKPSEKPSGSKKTDRITLDISDLKLRNGAYMIAFGDSSAEFVVR